MPHGDPSRTHFPEPLSKSECIKRQHWCRILFADTKYHLWYVVKYSWGGSGFRSLCGKSPNGELQPKGDDGTKRCRSCEAAQQNMQRTVGESAAQ